MSTEDIGYAQTLPRKLVHKWGFDQVFLTSYASTGENETVLGASLPRSHGFYCEFPTEDRTPDLALLIEVCRQACFVVAHTQFGVPVDGNNFQFLLKELSGEFVDTTVFRQGPPTELTVRCRIERIWRRGDVPSGLVWAFTVRVGDVVVATSRMRQTWIDRPTWRTMRVALRAGRGLPEQTVISIPPPSRLAPADVGRVNPANVVLEEVTEDGKDVVATVRADIRHPVLFDHPIDHLYAMVQMEACRQLSLLAGARRLGVPATDLEMCGVSAEFVSVAEFDLPTVVRARMAEPVTTEGRTRLSVELEITQGERLVSTFTLAVRPAAEGRQP
ncbi:AfsA-related hotdog domain-containing protein [Micromonospora sp. WMMD1120]|uniref:AfsA-related hotdog domain-containing protein n=1 Tax=Micromonospora sp. WMMD1120 TaxID=3016106 RepID=UPI002416021C|nr:AfsA-related hotdog domain-containing protein [Micromonospora sp. WMMD1120]MDG4810867.1 AfsA-related hotdog domain-containing protein [Micromonospora sp. WMMD1120]